LDVNSQRYYIISLNIDTKKIDLVLVESLKQDKKIVGKWIFPAKKEHKYKNSYNLINLKQETTEDGMDKSSGSQGHQTQPHCKGLINVYRCINFEVNITYGFLKIVLSFTNNKFPKKNILGN